MSSKALWYSTYIQHIIFSLQMFVDRSDKYNVHMEVRSRNETFCLHLK